MEGELRILQGRPEIIEDLYVSLARACQDVIDLSLHDATPDEKREALGRFAYALMQHLQATGMQFLPTGNN